MKFYVSFGQVHTHSFNGVTLDKDCLLEVKAHNELEARQAVIRAIGRKWGTVYREDELSETIKYFPRGVVATIDLIGN